MSRYKRLTQPRRNPLVSLFLWTTCVGFFILLAPQVTFVMLRVMVGVICVFIAFILSYTINLSIGRFLRSRVKWTRTFLMK